MNHTILDLIYYQYLDDMIDKVKFGKSNEEILFIKKYICTAIEKDQASGMEMENLFNEAICESDRKAFKDGFKVCARLMLECLGDFPPIKKED